MQKYTVFKLANTFHDLCAAISYLCLYWLQTVLRATGTDDMQFVCKLNTPLDQPYRFIFIKLCKSEYFRFKFRASVLIQNVSKQLNCFTNLRHLFWLFLTTFTFHFRLSRSLSQFHFVIYTDAFAIRRYIECVFLGTGNYIFNNEIYTTFYDFTLIWDSLLSVNTRFRLKYVESL